MFSPSPAFQQEYVQILEASAREDGRLDGYEKALINYAATNLTKEQCENQGFSNRMLLMLFKGQNAMQKLVDVSGANLPAPVEYGRTIRGTYGEYSQLSDGTIVNFQPAVLTAQTPQSNRKTLALLAKYAEIDGGIMKPANLHHKSHPQLETGLVMIKPDSLQRPSALPVSLGSVRFRAVRWLLLISVSRVTLSTFLGLQGYTWLEQRCFQ